MKKYIKIGDINEEEFDTFLSNISELEEGDILDITLYSGGGKVSLGEQIIRILEENKDKIELHASYMVSMAFDIFYKFTGKKYINKSCVGMVHTSSSKVSVSEGGIITGQDEFNYNNMKKYKPLMYSFLKKSEIKAYLDNCEIWLNEKRLRKIFKTPKN